MDSTVLKAYEVLVPADQTVIDTLILILAQKDKQIRELFACVKEHLNEAAEAAGENDEHCAQAEADKKRQ